MNYANERIKLINLEFVHSAVTLSNSRSGVFLHFTARHGHKSFLKDLNRKLLGTSLTLDCPKMMYLWQQMRTQRPKQGNWPQSPRSRLRPNALNCAFILCPSQRAADLNSIVCRLLKLSLTLGKNH